MRWLTRCADRSSPEEALKRAVSELALDGQQLFRSARERSFFDAVQGVYNPRWGGGAGAAFATVSEARCDVAHLLPEAGATTTAEYKARHRAARAALAESLLPFHPDGEARALSTLREQEFFGQYCRPRSSGVATLQELFEGLVRNHYAGKEVALLASCLSVLRSFAGADALSFAHRFVLAQALLVEVLDKMKDQPSGGGSAVLDQVMGPLRELNVDVLRRAAANLGPGRNGEPAGGDQAHRILESLPAQLIKPAGGKEADYPLDRPLNWLRLLGSPAFAACPDAQRTREAFAQIGEGADQRFRYLQERR